MKTLRFLSLLIFHVVLVPMTVLFLAYAFLSISTGGLSQPQGLTFPRQSIIEIESAVAGGSIVRVRVIAPGTYTTIPSSTIVAVYVTSVNGSFYGGALTPRIEFSPPANGTVVSVDVQKLERGAGKILEIGDTVKVVTADGGAASMTVT